MVVDEDTYGADVTVANIGTLMQQLEDGVDLIAHMPALSSVEQTDNMLQRLAGQSGQRRHASGRHSWKTLRHKAGELLDSPYYLASHYLIVNR